VSGLMRFRDGSNSEYASNAAQISERCDGDPHIERTSGQGRKHEPYTESPNSVRRENVRHVKNKVKKMLIIFFDVRGILNLFVCILLRVLDQVEGFASKDTLRCVALDGNPST
jgi:hypothetical protein